MPQSIKLDPLEMEYLFVKKKKKKSDEWDNQNYGLFIFILP